MNPEIKRRSDDENAARLEQTKNLIESPANLEDVFKGFDAQHRPGGFVGQGGGRDIFHEVHARTGPHIAADVLSIGKQGAEVGVTLLSLDLVGAEFEDRAGTVDRFGNQAAECLVVVSHRRGSSLSQAGMGGRIALGTKCADGINPSSRRVWCGS